jgi:Restriction endonuclease
MAELIMRGSLFTDSRYCLDQRRMGYVPTRSLEEACLEKREQFFREKICRRKPCSLRFLAIGRSYQNNGFCSLECEAKYLKSQDHKANEALGKKYKKPKKEKKRKSKFKNADKFLMSEAWMKLRYQVLRHYGRKCMCCGRKPPEVEIHVDHIKPRSKFPALSLDFNNLQVLCKECNLGKSAWDESDWRPPQSVPH